MKFLRRSTGAAESSSGPKSSGPSPGAAKAAQVAEVDPAVLAEHRRKMLEDQEFWNKKMQEHIDGGNPNGMPSDKKEEAAAKAEASASAVPAAKVSPATATPAAGKLPAAQDKSKVEFVNQPKSGEALKDKLERMMKEKQEAAAVEAKRTSEVRLRSASKEKDLVAAKPKSAVKAPQREAKPATSDAPKTSKPVVKGHPLTDEERDRYIILLIQAPEAGTAERNELQGLHERALA